MIVSMQMGHSDETYIADFVQLSIRESNALIIYCLIVLSKTLFFF